MELKQRMEFSRFDLGVNIKAEGGYFPSSFKYPINKSALSFVDEFLRKRETYDRTVVLHILSPAKRKNI